MTYDPERHHRRSIRLSGYDYAQTGAYFVTICAQDRRCLYGEVVDGEMVLSEAGLVVECWWHDLNRRFPTVLTDAFVVMPNHVHGVVLTGGDALDDGRATGTMVVGGEGAHAGAPLQNIVPPSQPGVGAGRCACPASSSMRSDVVRSASPSLSSIIGWFKTMTTNDYIRGVNDCGWPPFRRRLWQRNYYDRIIRNDRALDAIRLYIADNPVRWATDDNNLTSTLEAMTTR